MDYQTIKFEKDGNVGLIRLNRPERMNAVNETMYQEIQDVLEKTDSDNDIRALVITGSERKKGDIIKKDQILGLAGNLSRYDKYGILFSIQDKGNGLKFDTKKQKFIKSPI